MVDTRPSTGRRLADTTELVALVALLDEARAENTALREQLAAEQDAANDAITELIGQLDEARADRDVPPQRVDGSAAALLAERGA